MSQSSASPECITSTWSVWMFWAKPQSISSFVYYRAEYGSGTRILCWSHHGVVQWDRSFHLWQEEWNELWLSRPFHTGRVISSQNFSAVIEFTMLTIDSMALSTCIRFVCLDPNFSMLVWHCLLCSLTCGPFSSMWHQPNPCYRLFLIRKTAIALCSFIVNLGQHLTSRLCLVTLWKSAIWRPIFGL